MHWEIDKMTPVKDLYRSSNQTKGKDREEQNIIINMVYLDALVHFVLSLHLLCLAYGLFSSLAVQSFPSSVLRFGLYSESGSQEGSGGYVLTGTCIDLPGRGLHHVFKQEGSSTLAGRGGSCIQAQRVRRIWGFRFIEYSDPYVLRVPRLPDQAPDLGRAYLLE